MQLSRPLTALLIGVVVCGCSDSDSGQEDTDARVSGPTGEVPTDGASETDTGEVPVETDEAAGTEEVDAPSPTDTSNVAESDGENPGEPVDPAEEPTSQTPDGGGPAEGTPRDSGFDAVGVCGERGEATVDESTYDGYVEYYIIGDEGFGIDICIVRFEVSRVGEAPGGCDDCLWTHLLEYSNPEVLLDEGGVCASSELGLTQERMAEIAGTQVAVGFVNEYAGHNSVLMKYKSETDSWEPNGNASWDDESSASRFDRRDGFCDYAGSAVE